MMRLDNLGTHSCHLDEQVVLERHHAAAGKRAPALHTAHVNWRMMATQAAHIQSSAMNTRPAAVPARTGSGIVIRVDV